MDSLHTCGGVFECRRHRPAHVPDQYLLETLHKADGAWRLIHHLTTQLKMNLRASHILMLSIHTFISKLHRNDKMSSSTSKSLRCFLLQSEELTYRERDVCYTDGLGLKWDFWWHQHLWHLDFFFLAVTCRPKIFQQLRLKLTKGHLRTNR